MRVLFGAGFCIPGSLVSLVTPLQHRRAQSQSLHSYMMGRVMVNLAVGSRALAGVGAGLDTYIGS